MDTQFFHAYHATTSDRVQNIIDNNFRPSTRQASWLGTGSYFFFEGPQHALHWAAETAKRRNEKGLAVAGMTFKVKVDLTNAINLLDREYWALLKQAYSNVPANITQVGPVVRHLSNPLPANAGWNFRDFVAVNSFVEALEREGIVCDVVVAAFSEGQPVDPTSWLFDETSVILCVRNARAIQIIDYYSAS